VAVLNLLEAFVHVATARSDAELARGAARLVLVTVSLLFAALAVAAMLFGFGDA
jgi:hypothetical protein